MVYSKILKKIVQDTRANTRYLFHEMLKQDYFFILAQILVYCQHTLQKTVLCNLTSSNFALIKR